MSRTAAEILEVVDRYRARAATESARDFLSTLASWFVGEDGLDEDAYGVWAEQVLAIEAEAAATERRLTVERVWLRIYRDTEIQVRGADRLRSILDDLATAAVDEEEGK